MTTKSKPQSKLTGEQIAKLRNDGMKWTDIVVEAGLPEGSSAIPLRNLMYKSQGKQTKARSKKQMGEQIVRMRDSEGQGWPRIAAAMGLPVKDAKQLYTDNGGSNAQGRVYVKREPQEQPAKEDTSEGIKGEQPAKDTEDASKQ